MTEHEIEKIEYLLAQLNIRTEKIYQGLYGIPDTEEKGVCGEIKTLRTEHNLLKRNFYVLISFLVGSGVLGGGIWALLN